MSVGPLSGSCEAILYGFEIFGRNSIPMLHRFLNASLSLKKKALEDEAKKGDI